MTGTQDVMHPIDLEILQEVETQFCKEPLLVNSEFKNLADAILNSCDLDPPSTFLQALEVYFVVLGTLEEIL